MKLGMKTPPAAAGALGMIKHYLTSWPLVVGMIRRERR